jgi:hypothetical protein
MKVVLPESRLVDHDLDVLRLLLLYLDDLGVLGQAGEAFFLVVDLEFLVMGRASRLSSPDSPQGPELREEGKGLVSLVVPERNKEEKRP